MQERNYYSLALALSGGGIRAMVFHLGVLKWMAEQTLLERVSHISTVSGGSLVVGLIYQNASFSWPDSSRFLNDTYPELRKNLCTNSMVMGALRQLMNPANVKYLLSRANLLAQALKIEWGIDASLGDLPAIPEWSINGTTAETGKRFRFKRDTFGDYLLGYANSQTFPLAHALAVSAAFPGGFGPLAINTADYSWKKREEWDDEIGTAKSISIKYNKLHLYDGGVYDNLGLEPFFDAGKTQAKIDSPIIVSDAGAPLNQGFGWSALNPWRLKRVADIMSDQSRSLRVRSFANYLINNHPGAYFYIADLPSSPDSMFAASFPTTLRQLNFDEFDAIARHGYAVAQEFTKKYGLPNTDQTSNL